MNFWQFFTTCIPVVSLYSCSFSGRRLNAWWASGPCGRLMMSVSSVGGIPCSLHVWFTYWVGKFSAYDTSPAPGMSAVAASTIVTSATVESQPPRPTARIRLMTSRCRGPSRNRYRQKSHAKTVKTMPLKLSEYLDKNALYNYEEQLIGFSLNCCTRKCNSANNQPPIVENIW